MICRIELAGRALLFAAGTVLAMLLTALMIEQYNTVKSFTNEITENINRQTVRLSESGITELEGLTVTGADVVNFAVRNLSEYSGTQAGTFAVHLVDKASNRDSLYYSSAELSGLRQYGEPDYISPSSAWKCSIVRNDNRVITEVCFTRSDSVKN